ncbi:MAG: hypothetical protein ABIR33_13610 [Pyrinomonadaceae bacterium]
MALYTVVLDFHGGTYISQIHASSEISALNIWKSDIRKNLLELSHEDVENLNLSLENEEVVPLSNVVNVWCSTATVNESLALINIVKTNAD